MECTVNLFVLELHVEIVPLAAQSVSKGLLTWTMSAARVRVQSPYSVRKGSRTAV